MVVLSKSRVGSRPFPRISEARYGPRKVGGREVGLGMLRNDNKARDDEESDRR
ncbi:hypothetical protein M406DRAFT_320670 [Cryphonectria parasitica EP155]|uniref:Uncharacterized protein n=1 Tax=Cryphonectria parasitica (strain ATCC 38755 / EP155) TaxID=660469 RepID=A0A9P4YF47_CRYP1|nr:uncharacterized protein M406DRAFT_320670 [Cryphonectria parasitica EP155]KAF3771195.1 hypothetical protein M406DRAFT_320670 [Cryphonectria parasitica EP155]